MLGRKTAARRRAEGGEALKKKKQTHLIKVYKAVINERENHTHFRPIFKYIVNYYLLIHAAELEGRFKKRYEINI